MPPSSSYPDSQLCIGDSSHPSTNLTIAPDRSYDADASTPLANGNYGPPGVVMGQSSGAPGIDAGSAAIGGQITIDEGPGLGITLGGTANGGGFQSLISAISQGGDGDQDNKDNNSNGGTGGGGNVVNVTNSGILVLEGTVQPTTQGLWGIVAQSKGGVGGKQNNSVFGDQAGGKGGNGGSVTVQNYGSVTLGADGTPIGPSASDGTILGAGIDAESRGGSGGDDNGNAGNGGSVVVLNQGAVSGNWASNGGAGSVAGLNARSVGGTGTQSHDNSDNGGNGGNGGSVSVTNSALVSLGASGTFTGDGAAIAARSVGGEGGTGPSEDHWGGTGGAGSMAAVSVQSPASIQTNGENLYGVLAQSVGGQGGDGGDAALRVAGVGGGGGYGGIAGKAQVDIGEGAVISTEGAFSAGVVAQSIGGGGGTGGEFVAVLGGEGGNGGNGGNAGEVDIDNDGSITTQGDHAFGVLGQSVAGSGGTGGINDGLVVSLGGGGAGGGEAGLVSIANYNYGSVSTSGYGAHGIVAQSIGGGGGASGSATGLISVGGSAQGTTLSLGGPVVVTNTGVIQTLGDAAEGILAQSIGGGGGSGSDSVGVIGVGGSGQAGGSGGSVTLDALGTLTTLGDYSMGAVAQSIGGGGGDGGDTMTFSTGVTLAIGGSGQGGGDGGVACIGNAGNCANGTHTGTAGTVTTLGDYSAGLVAQSVGGGGGNGGSVTTYSTSFAALRIGGTAGAGGAGGQALVDYGGLNAATGGAHAIGVLAQSIGGGGGNGGDAHYFNTTVGFNAALTLGGSGGDGGSAAPAIVNLSDSHVGTGTYTGTPDPADYAPDDSFGVVAQTIGGGGGNGGSVTGADVVAAVPTGSGTQVSLNFTAAVGGNGGGGGDACSSCTEASTTGITLSGGSSVWTLGDGSHAVVAQSIGGGGGNGGDSSLMSAAIGYGDSLAIDANVAVGGGGAAAGRGGPVQVTLGDGNGSYVGLPGSINLPVTSLQAPDSGVVTYGNYADGVLAQSIGGGGGNAGTGSSDAYAAGTGTTLKVAVGVGGVGGGGGDGGPVNVTLNPNFTINTMGSGSRGIVAQSIGGGGGTSQGGTVGITGSVGNLSGRVNVGVGMTGGEGGAGGNVGATILGAIRTAGGDADGVLLQSVGGGGGLGGSMGADASGNPILNRIGVYEDGKQRLFDNDKATYELDTNIGGSGGAGGSGGNVNLVYLGKIATSGDMADGVIVQSIGGGGGEGGSATTSGSRVAANIVVGVGGTGGVGGNGGTVTAGFNGDHGDSVQTSGYAAYGVLLQSIGGGGGIGGDGSDQAEGTLTVGGASGAGGGAAGNGGVLNVGSNGDWLTVTTTGSDAPAFVAQSVGGGGGVGAVGNSTSAKEVDSHSVSISVGGSGGISGNGGEVDLTIGGVISTSGDRSHGMVAQSIGGGGGIGGAGEIGNGVSVALGGNDGASGDGGAVDVHLVSGNIHTSGEGAYGLVAQSIGGGGGIAGDTASELNAQGRPSHSGSDGSGSGGVVTITADAPITTTGAYAHGVVAQSIGGGGGIMGIYGATYAGSASSGSTDPGHTGGVTVTVNQSITTSGEYASAIFAQSESNGAPVEDLGNVVVNVNAPVTGGLNAPATVYISGGDENLLNVGTNGDVVAGPNSQAVYYMGNGTVNGSKYGYGALTVNNAGKIFGGVLCPGGGAVCSLNNSASGLLSDATTYQANVNNAGRLVIGHPGAFDELAVAGNFRQGATGVLQTTADFQGGRAAHLLVSGNGYLGGQVEVEPTTLLPDHAVTVASFGGTVQGLAIVQDSPVIDYTAYLSGKDLRVAPASANFASPAMGLASNEDAVARHIQRAWDLGGSAGLAPLFAALDLGAREGAKTYSGELQDLSPGISIAPGMHMHANMSQFADNLFSCPRFSGTDALTGEHTCLWGDFSGRETKQDSANGASSFALDTYTYQFGGQKEIKPGWFLGGSFAYQYSQLSGDDSRVNGSGNAGYLGVVLKHEAGSWTYSGSLSAGYGEYDLSRRISIPGLQSGADASPGVYGVGMRLRVARTFAGPNAYIKPYVDLDGYYTEVPGYTESGNSVHLKVNSSRQFVAGISPMVEVGGRVRLKNGAEMRAYVFGGASLLSKDGYTVSARLQGAPDGTGGFNTTLPMDRVMGRVGAGLQLDAAEHVSIRLEYEGDFSNHAHSNSGLLKVMMPF